MYRNKPLKPGSCYVPIPPGLHVESIDGHDVEIAQLGRVHGEIRWNSIVCVDHETGDAPFSLDREGLEIFRNISFQIEVVDDVKIA